MILIEKKRVRRRDKRIWYLMGVVFVAVFVFSFLVQRDKVLDDEVGAANLAAFDPGYIISDYQMSNYNSMNETEIQAFLKSKNSCNDGYINRYTAGEKVSYFSEMSPPRTWHVKDGHFVCMADETFDGGTAAHIIYKAAQDYKINPQVLLVLLEKEQSLVRDTFPHSQQYRSATGYGCPDTAACSAKYYGLQNQIRNAAALFRTVLDGGWTNYPLGENYVQYNPSAACGGSVVNIRNLATSALYRYTPYQPNAVTLAGGSNGCSAYGNLNFYRYFEDWFGGITDNNVAWMNMKEPRMMVVDKATLVIDAGTHMTTKEWAWEGSKYYFTKKTTLYWGGDEQLCLQRQSDEGTNKCILMARMTDYVEESVEDDYETIGPVLMKLRGENFYKYRIGTEEKVQKLNLKENLYIKITEKITIKGKKYYRTTHDVAKGLNYIIPADALDENIFVVFQRPRNLVMKMNGKSINLATGEDCIFYKADEARRYVNKIKYEGKEYYQNKNEVGTQCAVEKGVLEEARYNFDNPDAANSFTNFLWPRFMRLKNDIYTIDALDGTTCNDYLKAGDVQKYTTKITIGDQVFYRSETNTAAGSSCVVPAVNMGEI